MFDMMLPASAAEIARIQSARKRVALANARRAPYYRGRLDHVRDDRLDDPAEWAKIPLVTKETLRELSTNQGADAFCIAPRSEIAEYWRSGGTTGVPLFYPRTFADMRYAYVQLVRAWVNAGVRAGDVCHMSFPLGVHPAGQLWARTANDAGIGIVWVGSGANTPSANQIELIERLKPTVWMGMPSYGLHLANLAEAQGIDLANGPVRKVLVGAEALSPAKRAKLERMWGAEVHDLFGMTEVGILGGDSHLHAGFHIWTDQAFFECVDEATGLPVPEGTPGLMVITPLFTNNATTFLRWSSGDIVTMHAPQPGAGPFSVFPLMRHAHRTSGFFKIRGVNVNHAEFEDFMFRDAAVNDFRVELDTQEDLERFRVMIEVKRDTDAQVVAATLVDRIRATFELRVDLEILPTGTIARDFEASVKAPRFTDRRT